MKRCTKCEEEKSLSAFSPAKKASDGRASWCKACCAAAALKRQRADREKDREKPRQWRALNPLARYRMTLEQQAAIIAEQGGVCAVKGCGGEPTHVDHDHSCCPKTPTCGKCTRGLVCHFCNSAMGFLGDDPERLRAAAAYLEQCAA